MSRSRVLNISSFEQFTAINVLSDPGHIGGKFIMPNGVQITLQWGLGDAKFAANVMWGGRTDGLAPTVAQANGIMSALTTGAAWTALAAHIAPTAFINAVLLRDFRAYDQPIIRSSNAAVFGASTGTELPNEVALVVTLRTALVGQANRGRMFVPGWATTALGTGNTAAAAAVTALTNWSALVTTAMSGQGYQFSLGHPPRQAYPGATGTQHPARAAGLVPITSQVVRDNHWDSQRRRGLK